MGLDLETLNIHTPCKT